MAEVVAPAAVVDGANEIWKSSAHDSRSVQEVKAQEAFRAALRSDIGPNWASFVDSVRAGLSVKPYAVIVRCDGAADPRAMLAAVAVELGRLANPYGDLVPVLQDITNKGPKSPDLVWLWHTDSANWPVPNDYSALTCLRAAPAGGATQLLSLDSVRAGSGWSEERLAPLWESEFSWPLEQILGGGNLRECAIKPDGLRFRRELMGGADDPAFGAAVELFCALADGAEPDVSALLRPGDVLIFDNVRVMHRSGPVEDPQRQRLLVRTKIFK